MSYTLSEQILLEPPCHKYVTKMRAHIKEHLEEFKKLYPAKIKNKTSVDKLTWDECCAMIYVSKAEDSSEIVKTATETIVSKMIGEEIDEKIRDEIKDEIIDEIKERVEEIKELEKIQDEVEAKYKLEDDIKDDEEIVYIDGKPKVLKKGDCDRSMTVEKMIDHIRRWITYFPEFGGKPPSKTKFKKDDLCSIVLASRVKAKTKIEEEIKAKKEVAKQEEQKESADEDKVRSHCGMFVQFFKDLVNTKKYEPKFFKDKEIISSHQGQRKLFLTELYFLTKYGHLSNQIVYPGAAHGFHIPLLAALFPKHKFDLYDASPFFDGITKKYPDRIKVFKKYFLADDAKKYKNSLLISDIRTTEKVSPKDISTISRSVANDLVVYLGSSYVKHKQHEKYASSLAKKEFLYANISEDEKKDLNDILNKPEATFYKKEKLSNKINEILTKKIDENSNILDNLSNNVIAVTEESVLNDMRLQKEFVTNMKPKMAMLKFRAPYGNDLENPYEGNKFCLDELKKTDGKSCLYEFLSGELLLQPFAPITSTEMRLITNGQSSSEYDCIDIENKMFYLNADIRNNYMTFDGKETNWDKQQECAIIENFKIKFPKYANWPIDELLTSITNDPYKFLAYVDEEKEAKEEKEKIKEESKIKKEVEREEIKRFEKLKKEFATNLETFLESEDAIEKFINIVIDSNTEQKSYFKGKSQSEIENLTRFAMQKIIGGIKNRSINITSDRSSQIRVEIGRLALKDKILADYTRFWEPEDFELHIEFLQNNLVALSREAKDIKDKIEKIKTEREIIKFREECKEINKEKYLTKIIERLDLFPELIGYTDEEIRKLELDKICELIVIEKTKRIRKAVDRAKQYGNSLLATQAQLYSEINTLFDEIVNALDNYWRLLIIPQSSENDEKLIELFEGENRKGYFELTDWTADMYGINPQVNVDLMRHILENVLPFYHVLDFQGTSLFDQYIDFKNVDGSPFNNAAIQNKINSKLTSTVKDIIDRYIFKSKGKSAHDIKVEEIFKEEPQKYEQYQKGKEKTYLTGAAMELLRRFLRNAATKIAIEGETGGYVLIENPQKVSERAETLGIREYLSPEMSKEDKIINSFVWITVAGSDWLEKQNVDLWDVYTAIKIFLGKSASDQIALNLFRVQYNDNLRGLADKIQKTYLSLNPPVLISPNALFKLAAIINELINDTPNEALINKRSDLFNHTLPTSI